MAVLLREVAKERDGIGCEVQATFSNKEAYVARASVTPDDHHTMKCIIVQ